MHDAVWRSIRDELRGCFRRFRRDAAGNTIAMIAAAMIPLTAMIGSGVDMSRAYMAKQKLQAACDAGALAGRKIMQNDAVDTTVTTEVNKFVNFNFPQGTYDTAAFTPETSHPDKGIVQVKLSTTIPMAVMKMFGFTTLPLTVTCNASQNFVNTDIVLVLDTTGSMACDTSGNNCTGGSTSKIAALRSAVLALYDQLKPVQDQLEANGMRLRYSIVPYSTTVNVGKLLYAKNPAYMANTWVYQSQLPTVIVAPAGIVPQTDCVSMSSAANQAKYLPLARSYGYDVDYLNNGTWNSPSAGACTILAWKYKQRTGSDIIDTSQFIKGGNVNVYQMVTDPRPGSGTTNSTWSGCIQERSTNNTIDASSGYTIPSDANDLNIDMIPTSAAGTQWGPQWPEVSFHPMDPSVPLYLQPAVWRQTSNNVSLACPVQAKRLVAMTRGDMVSYLNTLTPNGNTYHDIGMIWGARFISPNGIFKSANPTNPTANDPDNPTVYNGMPVNRFVIFMTDGKMEPATYTDDAYGLEQYQHKTGAVISSYGDAANLTIRHRQRFKMACNATKGLNVSIWTIYFGSPSDVPAVDTQALTDCASNTAQFSPVANQTDLINKFVEIGKNIGALRLAK